MTEPELPRRLTDSFQAKEPPADFASRVVDALSESALSEPQSTYVDAPQPPRTRRIPSQALWWAAGVLVGAAVTIVAMRLSVQVPAQGEVISASPAPPDTKVGQHGGPQDERDSDTTQSEATGTNAPNRPKRILDAVTTGTLILTTERPATVFANGKKIGTTPLQKALRPGNYKLAIRSTECSDKTFRIDLGVGEVLRKSLTLCGEETTPNALGKGKVRLATTPWTEVYFRGKKLGATPDVFELPAGNQKLDLVHVESGCELSLIVPVRAGATDNKRVSFTLRECASWRDGVKPSSSSSSDKASNDKASNDKASNDKASSDKASSDKASSDKASSVKPGNNKASSDKASSDKASSDKASSETGSTGTLILVTSPWSKVFKDGKKIGNTPLKKKLPVGIHRLSLKNAGAECEKQILVEIKENASTSLRLQLCN